MNNVIMQNKDIKPVKLYVMATPTGFACGLIDEDLYDTEEYYISLTLARGMLRLALKNPNLVNFILGEILEKIKLNYLTLCTEFQSCHLQKKKKRCLAHF